MNTEEALSAYNKIQEKICQLPVAELHFSGDDDHQSRAAKIDQIIELTIKDLGAEDQSRVRDEFHQLGPLEKLLRDESVTEILVNGPFSIWFETRGRLHSLSDRFFSELSFRNALNRLCDQAKIMTSIEHPVADGEWNGFRLSVIGPELTRSAAHVSFRRHPKNPWNFERLNEVGWADGESIQLLRSMLSDHKNFLVIGGTGSGKTSVLNACLQELPCSERAVVIEDTSEIALPNTVSMKILTRHDPQGLLPEIDQAQLVRRSLRLRPDRIVMGEIRGDEAKDFLMALATGHAGSFGTLHASSPAQALIRLEMLIQMGAPQWSLTAIRRLIQLSLDYVIVTERSSTGQRKFTGLYRISSLEEHGFLTEKVLNLQQPL